MNGFEYNFENLNSAENLLKYILNKSPVDKKFPNSAAWLNFEIKDGAVVHHYVNKSVSSERNEFHCQITPFKNPFDGLGGYTLHYFEKKEWKVFVFVDVEQLLAMISRLQRSIDDQVISEVAEKRAIYSESMTD
jgi:hypothetical protein